MGVPRAVAIGPVEEEESVAAAGEDGAGGREALERTGAAEGGVRRRPPAAPAGAPRGRSRTEARPGTRASRFPPSARRRGSGSSVTRGRGIVKRSLASPWSSGRTPVRSDPIAAAVTDGETVWALKVDAPRAASRRTWGSWKRGAASARNPSSTTTITRFRRGEATIETPWGRGGATRTRGNLSFPRRPSTTLRSQRRHGGARPPCARRLVTCPSPACDRVTAFLRSLGPHAQARTMQRPVPCLTSGACPDDRLTSVRLTVLA